VNKSIPSGLLLVSGTEPATLNAEQRQTLIDLAGLADELLDSEQARQVAAFARERLEEASAHSQHLVEELSRSNRQLEHFAYVASHDLQEPLRMVTGFLGLLVDEYASQLDEEAHEYIDYAVDGAKRMRHLINDLLAYSRVFSSDEPFVTVDTEHVFNAARDEVLRNHPEVEAIVSHEPLPKVRGRRQQLQRLFSNLLSNALQYSSESPRIEVWSKERDDDFIFALSDNGIGVELDQQERIFQIFVRGVDQPSEQGTGIGLAICTSIVEAHGGDIWVESAPGEGATFYFTLAKELTRKGASL
jgi:light-regulated signal transduction histidine kinase (bacteriophytochrome)